MTNIPRSPVRFLLANTILQSTAASKKLFSYAWATLGDMKLICKSVRLLDGFIACNRVFGLISLITYGWQDSSVGRAED